MGHGGYSFESRTSRAATAGYHTKSRHELFSQNRINNAMNPKGIVMRESRDSEEHPASLPIILGLDVTGSMGSVPHQLLKDGLPTIMAGIIQRGIPDPQLLFMGIGDHECDEAPLQVAQFESSDELLDKWLTDVYLEGGGGGNMGESYALAWYFAANHTTTDSLEKRGQKGFLFTIGDEPVLKNYPISVLQRLMGETCTAQSEMTAAELLDMARQKFQVYHLHIAETASGARPHVLNGWRELMGDNCVVVERHEDLAKIVANILIENTLQTGSAVPEINETKETADTPEPEDSKNDNDNMML